MRARRLVAAVALAAFLGVAAYASTGDGALQDAADTTLSAPQVIVSHGGGSELLLSRNLTVIKRRGRVIAWTATDEEFTRRQGQRCYERHTDWNRDDVHQQRAALVPTDLTDVDVDERDGMRVISGREEHLDHADTEYRLRLDRSGRVVELRSRSAEFGVLAAGRWRTATYRYPTAAEFARAAGPAPTPRCR